MKPDLIIMTANIHMSLLTCSVISFYYKAIDVVVLLSKNENIIISSL